MEGGMGREHTKRKREAAKKTSPLAGEKGRQGRVVVALGYALHELSKDRAAYGDSVPVGWFIEQTLGQQLGTADEIQDALAALLDAGAIQLDEKGNVRLDALRAMG
jgi:hypothetical protein